MLTPGGSRWSSGYRWSQPPGTGGAVCTGGAAGTGGASPRYGWCSGYRWSQPQVQVVQCVRAVQQVQVEQQVLTDAERLPEAHLCGLVDGLIRQRAGPGHDAWGRSERSVAQTLISFEVESPDMQMIQDDCDHKYWNTTKSSDVVEGFHILNTVLTRI